MLTNLEDHQVREFRHPPGLRPSQNALERNERETKRKDKHKLNIIINKKIKNILMTRIIETKYIQ